MGFGGQSGEVREEAAEPDGPVSEVVGGGPKVGSGGGVEVIDDGDEEAEELIVGFVRGQEVFRDFGEEVQDDGGFVGRSQRELTKKEVARSASDQFPGFAFAVMHANERQALQSGTKRGLWLPGRAGRAAQFAFIAGEETDD